MRTTKSLYTAFKASVANKKKIPLYTYRLQAGFTSPAESYMVGSVNLNQLLLANRKTNTLYVPVRSKDMELDTIHFGDLVIVDQSVKQPKSGAVILCLLNDQPLIRIIKYNKDKNLCWLESSEEDNNPVQITADDQFVVHGIVTYSVTSHTLKRAVCIIQLKSSPLSN